MKQKQKIIHHANWHERVFGIIVLGLFAGMLIVQIPVTYVLQWFVAAEKQAALWRLIGHHNCLIFLRLWGVEIDSRYREHLSTDPVIYASNHPSMIDGFVTFALLGPNVVTLTAPFSSFGFPFNYWFRKMGFVDVQRDADDVVKHPTANTKEQAFRKLFRNLHDGVQVLIFPEGHVERTNTLHYVHTGVARISLQADIPIQALTLVGMDQVFFPPVGLRKGRITIRFGRKLLPPSVSRYVPFRKVVKAYTNDVERAITSILPIQYLPEYYNIKPEGIAAFIDIDNTIYNGYSMKDFVRYLLKRKSISRWLPFKVLYWIGMEKMHLLSHRQLMKLSFSVLGGFQVKQFDQLCQQFFDNVAKHNINHHVLPTIKDHLSRGHLVILVSEAMHPLARLFQYYVGATASIDTVLHKHKHKYTGEVAMLNYGYTKAEQIEDFAKRFGVDLNKSYAYTDSSSDLPLLYVVRHKIVVNPDDHLKELAVEQNWPSL